MRNLVVLFLETTPHTVQRVKTALSNQDAAELREAVHSLDNSVGVLGDTKAYEQLRIITELTHPLDWPQLGERIAELDAHLLRLHSKLRRFLGTP